MKIALPTKPITKVYIDYSGDMEAGMLSQHFVVEVFIDPTVFADELDAANTLEEIRNKFREVYLLMYDENPSVTFDFEQEYLLSGE